MKHKLLLFLLLFLVLGLSAQKCCDIYRPQLYHPPLSPALEDGGGGSTGFTNAQNFFGVCGMNYTYGSVMTQTRTIASHYNTNGTGFPATISISGLPASCFVVLHAYLYYDASYTEHSVPAPTVSITNPSALVKSYADSVIGTGPAKCWGEQGTANYRVDVTPSVTGNGNYIINFSGFANEAWEVDGATLFIIYQAGPTNGTTGSLFLFNGGVVQNDQSNDWTNNSMPPYGDSIYAIPVCNNTSIAQSFFLMGDQTAITGSYTTNVETCNGASLSFPNNQWNFNVIPITTTLAQNTVPGYNTTFFPYRNDFPPFGNPPTFDCYDEIMFGMYWQNTGCVNCLPSVSISSKTNLSCNANNSGSFTINASNGTTPYTYSWGTGQTSYTSTITGLSAGTYTLTVEDAICNTAQTTVTITQPVALISSKDSTGVLCYGGNTGTATINSSGGTSPYTYSWSNGQTKSSATGLSAGTYTITMQDKHGCSETAAITITQPATAVSPAISANAGIICYGATTTATLSTSGGTSPYTYLWSPIGGTNATGTGLTAGTYTVTIKDKNGCTPTSGAITVIVTQPAAPVSPTISANPGVSCFGGTTTATLSVSGGTSPYTYSWSPIGGTNSTGTGLTVGTYTVTIKDINGCTPTAANTTVVVTQPAAPVSPTISANPGVSCYGGTTTATLSVSGGTSPYTYSWSPIGGTNSIGTGLTAGTYTIIVKDKNGCTPTSGATTVIVTQPAAPVSPVISANPGVTCYGGTTTVTITTSGGTSPYTYSWSPIGGTNATGTGLTVGTYTITIKDKNGCTATSGATMVIVTQPAAYGTTISSMHASCGLPTGSATVSVTGSTSPYTYSWKPSGQTTSTATGLSAGVYTVTVTDINSCTTTASITVTQTSSVGSTLSTSKPVSCYGGNDGTATITTTGGTAPYTYTWSPIGGTNATGTGLTAGTYTVNVVDAQGCIGTSATIVIITQPAAPVSPVISANPGVSCYGGTTTATLSVSGGTSPYTYSWSPIGGTNATGTGLTVGTYTVTIKDINGCTATSGATTVIVTQPAAPVSPTISANPGVSCYGATTTATITTSGGTSPYTYDWSPIGGTNATGTGLTVGTYTVTIKDINGCTATSGATTVIVTQPAAPVNPTISANGGIACYGGTTTATITTSGGTSPYTYSWSPIGGTNATGTGLTVGTYTVTIKDKNGCTATSGATTVVVTQPNAPVNPVISANSGISCNGGTTTATITTSGGTSPYTYSWSPIGGTNATGTGLTVGTYTVTIKDANGCSSTSGTSTIVVITQPAPIKDTVITSLGIACNGGTEDVTISTSGGTSPYTYLWSPGGGTNAKGTGLTAGTYTVYITDKNGCTGTATSTIVTVTQPSMLWATTSVSTPISCNGGIGTAIVIPSGGTLPYTYSWSPVGGTNATGTGLTAGTYTITVSDNNHCSSTSSVVTVVMTQPTPYKITVKANNNDTIICAKDSATIEAVINGGAGGLITYKWSNGATSSSITVSDSLTTTYTAVVYTPCDTFTVTQKITVLPIPTMTVCCNTKILIGEDTTLVAMGGEGDIKTFTWNQPDPNSLNHDTGRIVIATPTVTTTYTVTGTDTSGCEVVRFVTIVIEIPCNFTVPNVFTPTYAGTSGVDNKLYINDAAHMDTWSITIFDRWGVKLFSSNDPFVYWDGNTSGGGNAPAGVYYYIINAGCQGHNIQKDGYVQLIR